MKIQPFATGTLFEGLPVEVSLNRTSDNTMEGGYWMLEMRDRLSRFRILELRLTDAQLGLMLAGRHQDLELHSFIQAELRGWTMETRKIWVSVGMRPTGMHREYRWKEWLENVFRKAEEENPGWKADHDTWNSHRLQGKKKLGKQVPSGQEYEYEVVLRRYTPPQVEGEQLGNNRERAALDQAAGEQGEAPEDAGQGGKEPQEERGPQG